MTEPNSIHSKSVESPHADAVDGRSIDSSSVSTSVSGSSSTRIDAAHPIHEPPAREADPVGESGPVEPGMPTPATPASATAIGASPPILARPPNDPPVEQAENTLAEIQTQAAQLAAHLQTREDELDQREADLNAQFARVDNEVRRARLWLEEHRAEVERRELACADLDRQIEERLARTVAAESRLHRAQQQVGVPTADNATDATPDDKSAVDKSPVNETTSDERGTENARTGADPADPPKRGDDDVKRRGELSVIERRLARHETALRAEEQRFRQRRQSDQDTIRRLMQNVDRHRSAVQEQLAVQQHAIGRLAAEHHTADRSALEVAERQIAELQASNQRLAEQLAARRHVESAASDRHAAQSESHRAALAAAEQSARRSARAAAMAEFAEWKSEIEAQRAAQQRHVEEAESLLADEQSRLTADRRQLDAERAALAEQSRAERQRLDEGRRRDDSELGRKRESLRRHSEQLDARRAAMEQLRGDLAVVQRETLEMRLATEELWIQLSGRVPPAALAQSLGQIRGKLAEHYRQANHELEEHRQQLETHGQRVARQLEEFKQERQQLQEWARQRNEEIEEQAARLVAREQELDRQETRNRQLGRQWQEEQGGYQQEIRRLLAELRRAEPAGVS